jgi:hypothetical protein
VALDRADREPSRSLSAVQVIRVAWTNDALATSIDKLVAASNENTEVRYSFRFRHAGSTGLIPHLHRLGSRQFARGER